MRYIPGQEKDNMEFMKKHGIGIFATTETEFFNALDYFMKKEEQLVNNYPVILCDIRPAIKETIDLLLAGVKNE